VAFREVDLASRPTRDSFEATAGQYQVAIVAESP
jgi:hypothetical protein